MMNLRSRNLFRVTAVCWIVFSFLGTNATASDERAAGASAQMVPQTPQPAGSSQPVRFEVTLGPRGLPIGGSLRLEWGHWRPAREFRLRDVTATSSVPDVQFETTVPPKRKHWPPDVPPTIVTLERGGPMIAGSKVVITGRMQYTRFTNVAAQLRLLTRHDERAKSSQIAEWTIRAVQGPMSRIRCIAESRPVAGEPARVVVAATDQYGNPAVATDKTIRLTCNTNADLPAEYTFTDNDDGSHVFSADFPSDRVSRVQVKWGDLSVSSNPILPRRVDEPGILFGDIHSHCEISSDAVGDPDAAYDYARRFWGLDFGALSDHSPRGERWKRAVESANRNNQDGVFATLLGFEWSSSDFGHRNIYYRGDFGPEQPRLPDNMASWWEWLDERQLRAVVVPHHTNTESTAVRKDGTPMWRAADWSAIDHRYQRLVEICQNRGSFEAPGGPNPELRIRRKDCGASAQAALAQGHQVGFFGSTDTHSGRPGTGEARCAVLASELTRDAVWDALYARRCYGTTGAHIIVLFDVNRSPSGSEITIPDAGTARVVTWRAVGTNRIKRVDLLRNNEIAMQWPGRGGDDMSETFNCARPLDQEEWWYLRVLQDNGEIAWSSPIWVRPE